jgi:hypothetical protein
MVTHTCKPSYSGGRDQEDGGLKPAPGKSQQHSTPKLGMTVHFCNPRCVGGIGRSIIVSTDKTPSKK